MKEGRSDHTASSIRMAQYFGVYPGSGLNLAEAIACIPAAAEIGRVENAVKAAVGTLAFDLSFGYRRLGRAGATEAGAGWRLIHSPLDNAAQPVAFLPAERRSCCYAKRRMGKRLGRYRDAAHIGAKSRYFSAAWGECKLAQFA